LKDTIVKCKFAVLASLSILPLMNI
jgi:hypothetical protein